MYFIYMLKIYAAVSAILKNENENEIYWFEKYISNG